MFQTFCLIFILIVPSFSVSNKLERDVIDYVQSVDFKSNFAYEVVKKVYENFRQWFFTIILCDFAYFENRILKYTETYGYGHPVMLIDGCPAWYKIKVKPKLNPHGTTAYIVTSNELSLDVSDEVIYALLRTGVWKPRALVIFVITVPVEVNSYFYFEMRRHFDLIWSRRITNSVLILWSDRMRIYMYNRYLSRVIEVTESANIASLLSKQFNNMYGYELRLSVFRKIFLDDSEAPVQCDSRLTHTVISHLNATCTALRPRDGHTVGDLLENGTTTGVTADLIDGYTELELNSRILQNSYYGYIDTTYPMVQDNLCFVVPKSGKQSSFTTAIKLLSTDILLILLFNMVIFIFIAVLVRRNERQLLDIRESLSTGAMVTELVKCFLRQTVEVKFPGQVFRMVVLMIMIYSLIVDCAIDGIVTSALTYPRFKEELDYMSQLEQSNLTIAVHTRHMELFKKSPLFHDVLQSRIKTFSDKNTKNVLDGKSKHYAILMRESDGKRVCRKLSHISNGIPLYHVMKDCPVPCTIVYGLRYGSPYLPRLNNILRYLNQAGILDYWGRTEENSLYEAHYKALSDSNQRKPFTMANLQEVFYVWLSGLLISIFVFLIEIGLRFFKHLWTI